MLDESIPLTTNTDLMNGVIRKKKYTTIIRRATPYENVTAKNYPNLLVTPDYTIVRYNILNLPNG